MKKFDRKLIFSDGSEYYGYGFVFWLEVAEWRQFFADWNRGR